MTLSVSCVIARSRDAESVSKCRSDGVSHLPRVESKFETIAKIHGR